MKAIKKISKAAKSVGRTRVDYIDETSSMLSRDSEDDDEASNYEEYEADDNISRETARNWEKIAVDKRLKVNFPSFII